MVIKYLLRIVEIILNLAGPISGVHRRINSEARGECGKIRSLEILVGWLLSCCCYGDSRLGDSGGLENLEILEIQSLDTVETQYLRTPSD